MIVCYSSGKSKGAKLGAKKHRQDLEKLLRDSDKVSVDSGFDGGRQDDVEDDAIELLGEFYMLLLKHLFPVWSLKLVILILRWISFKKLLQMKQLPSIKPYVLGYHCYNNNDQQFKPQN